MNVLDYILVCGLILAAAGAVCAVRLLRSVIALAGASVLLTIILFRLDSPLAAVFELSVCAGLIPAIFISTIGLTGRTAQEDLATLHKAKLRRYWLLPVLLVVVAGVLTQIGVPDLATHAPVQGGVREVLWNFRQVDLVGQIVVLLAGALGVVVLVKERKNEA